MRQSSPVSGRLLGTAVSLAGVVVVRVVATHVAGDGARWLTAAGYVIVAFGLYLFARATSQRAELRSNGAAQRR
jgi:hypothetical protein